MSIVPRRKQQELHLVGDTSAWISCTQGYLNAECLSFGAVDTEVLGSTSIAFSEALEDREFGAQARASGLGVRLNLGPSKTGVCGPFEVDGAAAIASIKWAEGVTTRPLCG
ncbi:hypothetical protein HPB52_025718 [Rhipicephalus sanguineus]|uniref:Uncharacterized protein n=1 Tax=Rhipicephalus sanguineus TaxID=34632 RepID=A0A9D4SMS3_RHISA|nr:hypothetical protein HPB52_025718 [Rhipicephalus sanguineus]